MMTDPVGRTWRDRQLCLAQETDSAYFDPLAVDPKKAADVTGRRKAERLALSVVETRRG